MAAIIWDYVVFVVVAKIWTHIVNFRVFSVTTTLPKLEKLLEQPLKDANYKSTPFVLW